MHKKISNVIFGLGITVIFSGLALLAYLGFYNRYWADDWCYNADAVTLGTLPATFQYFIPEHTGYSTNRYSLTFFSALNENTLGMLGNKLVATTTILLWLIGLVWVGYNITRLIKPVPFSILLFASSFLLLYDLYISPQRFQILYWRSGVLPYSTALIFWMFILGFITHQMTRQIPAPWINFVVALLAFFGAGLGEISCTLIFTGTSILLAAAWFFKRRKQAWAEKSFQTIFVAWLFLLIGMIVLIVSPSNFRVAELHAKRGNPLTVPFVSLAHALDFIFISLRTLPIPHLVYISSVASLAILSTQFSVTTSETKKGFQRLAIEVLLIGLITYGLIVVIQAPTAYFYDSYPDPRGQSLSRFMMLVGLSISAWFIGTWLAEKAKNNWLLIASMVLLFIGILYTARGIQTMYSIDAPGFIRRAQAWDARDATIKEAKANGVMLIEAPAIDVGEIRTQDMFPSKGKVWSEYTLTCSARYYGVDGLKAIAPQP